MAIITLNNMQFRAYHGCLDFEKEQGNTFTVTLRMALDTSLAEETDELGDTLNYQLVYDVVKREMEIPSNLIEHAGKRILDAVFDSFPQIHALNVRLSKMNPPLGDKVDSVTVELEKSR